MDIIGLLPLRMVVPITDWKAVYASIPWFVELPATIGNGLNKNSGADTFKTKSVSESGSFAVWARLRLPNWTTSLSHRPMRRRTVRFLFHGRTFTVYSEV